MPGNVTWLLVTIRCLLLTPIDTVKCSKPILTVSVVYHCEHRDWLTMIYRNFFQILPVAILIQRIFPLYQSADDPKGMK